MNFHKFWLRWTLTNSLRPLKDQKMNMKKGYLIQLRNPFRIVWSSLCKLRRVITSMLDMRRSLLSWHLRLMLENLNQGQSKWERGKTLKLVQTRIRVLQILEKVLKNLAPRLMMKAWKIKWLLYWGKFMTNHAILNFRKMISNHIQMLNHSSTSSLMMSRLKFWKWNEIFERGLIRFKVVKSRLRMWEIVQNLPIALLTRNEIQDSIIFIMPKNIQKSLWLRPKNK